MYCTQCGFKLEDDMKMCPICGAEVEKSAPSVDEGRTTEQQIQQEPVMQTQEKPETQEPQSVGYGNTPNNYGTQQNGGYSQYGNNYSNYNMNGNAPTGQYNGGYYNQPQQTPPKKKGSGKAAVIVLCCIVLVAAIGIGAFFIFGSSSKTSVEEDFEPITNSKDETDEDVYQDYGDSPFYENPFDEETTESSENVSMYKGSTVDGVYTNDFFGITYNIPNTYYSLTEEEIISYYGDNNDDMSVGVVGLDLIGENYSEMLIYAQKLGSFSKEFYLNSFVVNTLSGVDEADYEVSDVETVYICGVEFAKKDVEFVNYNPDTDYRYNSFYVTEKDGVFLVVYMFYDDVHDSENLMNNFVI